MFFPYARIIPMHLTIIFGCMFIENVSENINNDFLAKTPLLLFMVLKTCADAAMHIMERKGFGDTKYRSEKSQSQGL